MRFAEHELLATYNYTIVPPLLIDVGAHRGRVSLVFARKGWRVIAFEPEPRNRAAFQRNLAGFDQVYCSSKAVSDVTGHKVPFYVSDEHNGIHALKAFHRTHRVAFEVETVRLDDALADLNITSVTLLKVDIEGADFLALKGFDFGKYRPEVAIVEFMDDRSRELFGYTHHDMVAYMAKRSYKAFVSEWAPISEYGREGLGDSHIWVGCAPYPLDHELAWGNLIFVPPNDIHKFSAALRRYLVRLTMSQFPLQLKKLPGVRSLYRLLKGH